VVDGRIEIGAADGVINKLAHAVAPAQILFRGGGVGRRSLCQVRLFRPDSARSQAVNNVLHDRVLNGNDVAGVSVDAIAPENFAGAHVEQLHRYSQ
jgi:hypothetical protein